MTKRVRGQVRAHRKPGARPPSDRARERRPAPLQRPSELAEAAAVAEEVVQEEPEASRAAAAAARPTQRAGTRIHHKIKAGSILAARAASEYVYVAQDMRRILLVAGFLIGLLFALWLLIVVMRVIALPFY